MNARLCPCSHKPSSRAAKSGVSGFTMIEVMVVVAIIAILAALVIPEYSDYVTRSRIPEATSALANKRARMELFYDNNRSYAAAPDCAADSTTSRFFTFEGDCEDSTYVLTATGTGAMDGFVFTINQVNAKATTDVPDGWTENASCWVSRKGGAC